MADTNTETEPTLTEPEAQVRTVVKRKRQKPGTSITFVRPINKVKSVERANQRAECLLHELGIALDREMRKAKHWTIEEWENKAGYYADLKAIRKYVVDEDCFEVYRKNPDGTKTIQPGIEEGLGFATRLLKRFIKEGADGIVSELIKSYNFDMTWQSRSGDKKELAQILMIGY